MPALCRQLPVEVLEIVFAQISSHTLFKSVRLVCKQWHLVCQWYVVQNLIWNDNRYTKGKSYFSNWKTLEDVLSGLASTNRKPSRTRLVWTSNGDMTTWSSLVAALARLNQEYQAQQSEGQNLNPERQQPLLQQEPTSKVVLLTELVLIGDYKFQYRFGLIMPYLSSLTSLQLHIHNTLELDLDLDSILFQTCPKLLRLHIRGGARPVRLISESATREVRGSREISKFRLKLKSLALYNVKVDQVPLEHYLSLSPHLIDLRLTGLDMTARRNVNWRPAFISHIQQCTFAPHMRSFHLSFTSPDFFVSELLTVADIRGLLDFESKRTTSPDPLQTATPVASSKSRLSNVTDWGFALSDVTPAFKSSLFRVRNLVTSLTLTSNYSFTSSVESGLHDYLCASPLLLHLYTDSIVQVRSLDPYAAQHCRKAAVESGTWNGTLSEYDALMAPRGIWACQNLKTLHVKCSDDRPLENRWAVCFADYKDLTHAQARVIFGYLAKVCPNLEELHIELLPADLGLQSGLCLLSRLKRLERLEIAMSAPILFWPLERQAWDWIAYRKTRLQAWLRDGELFLWDPAIREEEWQLREESMELEEELTRVRQEAEVSRSGGLPADSPEVPRLSTSSVESQDSFSATLTWDDLSEVGKLSDVKAALKELYADWKTPCWPMLEEFRVYGSTDVQSHVQTIVDNLRCWPRAV
ncbi:hypothetical protein BGZ93_000466 [Podila epicladia]|nr:hypothetical protein BGZ92_008151 [Podila epicladia]KAG0098324.1 hypothetical protein BGZ93_000466 [Podila epicladia]